MNKETRQKLEAIIRADIENLPTKYRDARAMLYYGITPYKDMTEQEINETFESMGITITQEDIN